MPIRVGLDLVAVANVRNRSRPPTASATSSGSSPNARSPTAGPPAGVDPERLAARFAAKEATLKVLPAADEGVSWQEIEVRREASGRVHIELRGRAAELAAQARISDLALSLTHEGGFAAAVVVAEVRERAGRES